MSLAFLFSLRVMAKIVIPFDFFSYEISYTYVCARSFQLCLTICQTMDYYPPGSSVHGISQARIPE